MNELMLGILGVRHPHVFPRVSLLYAEAGVKVVGFAEPDEAIASRFAAETGLTAYGGAEQLLAEGLDVVIIESLDPQVPVLARMAANAGVRVMLLEKPGASSPSDFLALAAELDALGVHVEIGYELHYCDAVQACRELWPALGDLTLARFHAGCPIGAGAELWQSIQQDVGGLTFTEGSHMLEIVADLLGVPDAVHAAVRRLPERPPMPALVYKPDLFSAPDPTQEVAVGTLVHEDVSAAILHYPEMLATVDFTAWEPTWWCEEWSIEAYGTNGSLRATLAPMDVRLSLRSAACGLPAGVTVRRAEQPAPGTGSLTPSYARQLHSLLAVARGQTPKDACDLSRAVDVMRMLDAIYIASTATTTPLGPALGASANE